MDVIQEGIIVSPQTSEQQQQQKRPEGQPTKYRPEYVQDVDDYLKVTKFETKRLPTVEGLAIYIGIKYGFNCSDENVNNWATRKLKDENGNKTKKLLYPQFFTSIKKLKAVQKEQLIHDGLYGGKNVNQIMAIFLLKVNHGMVETHHTDLTTKGKELPVPLLGGVSNVPTDNSVK